MAEEKETGIKINPVILTPEVVDQFRLNYKDPSEALARDIVETMKVDYSEQIAEDPNFLSYEGLASGTAPFLDFLPSTKGKAANERRYSADQQIVLFSNAQPATFMRPFLSEFAKSVPATEAMAATARLTGPRIIPSATAAGAAIGGPPGAAIGFGLGVLGTAGLSLLAGAGVYTFADSIEEQIMGPDVVITPGQRAEYEAYRTLGGGSGAIRFPWLFSTESNLVGKMMLKNIADDAAESRAMKLASGLDKIISSTGKAAARNPILTGVGESVATTGSALGAYQAEQMNPGSTGTRLAGELIGGASLYATLAKTLPRLVGSGATEEIGGVAVNNRQRKLFENINKLYADYGTPEQYNTLIENLTGPEMTAQLQEAFPGVDFTAAQRGGDPLLMGVESLKAEGEVVLDVARKKAERESYEFINKFIKGLISDGDPANLQRAAVLRASVFDDTLREGLNKKMQTFLAANKKLAAQPGQSAERSKQELSEQLYGLVDEYITAAGKKERELWGAVPNIEVIQPLGPDADLGSLPKFLQIFEKIGYADPAVQKEFAKNAPVLFNFIEGARSDLGLNPKAVLSEAEISTLDRYKSSFDNAVVKLGGFKSTESDLSRIMGEANQLPLAERAKFLRTRQADIKSNLKKSAYDDTLYPEGQRRLAVSLEKAADYFSAQAASESRAAQRSGEASTDVTALTADRLAEVRSQLLRTARKLAADADTSDFARRVGLVAESISDDLDVDGFGEAYDIARAYTRAKHDFFSRTVVGDVGKTQRSGASRLPAEVTFETFIKANPSITLHRVRQLQGMAEFADQQGLPSFLPEETLQPTDAIFTTTTDLIDSYLRGLKEVASKEVFDTKTNTSRTVINANALEQWKSENAGVLEAFPQLSDDLADASKAQRAVEVMDQNVKESRKLARGQTYLSDLLDGVSPTVAVSEAFNSKNPVRHFRNLFALRRMGADRVKSRVAARQGQTRALLKIRNQEIDEAGLKRSEINDAMGRAVLEHAYLEAGGEGAFNPQVFYKTLFEKMPKSDKTLMQVADQFNIFNEQTSKRLKFMSEQLMRVQAADATGKLNDPDFLATAGPIVDFYVGVLGSAAGSRAFGMVGGQGPGVIAASGTGARELRKFLIELPATAKLRAIDLMFTNPKLIAALMQKPGDPTSSTFKSRSARQAKKILGLLQDKLYNNSISMAPFVVREAAEEEDRGINSPLAEDPEVEIPALQQRLNQQIQKQNMPPNNQQGALNPPALSNPTASSGPAPSPMPPPAAIQTATPNSGPVDRARFAALFPEDRELLGIGSLMEGPR